MVSALSDTQTTHCAQDVTGALNKGDLMNRHEDDHQLTSADLQQLPLDKPATPGPIFYLRCGGIRLIVDHVPYKLIALIGVTTTGMLGAMPWIAH
ncbi:hypothetical protein [Streptomyces sp. NPDC053560]|uniref:hypothetical protein n=1 Tax=Streptomyces sp. NPDC053560 TaxID=3365711 RepID=UPI0037D2394D